MDPPEKFKLVNNDRPLVQHVWPVWQRIQVQKITLNFNLASDLLVYQAGVSHHVTISLVTAADPGPACHNVSVGGSRSCIMFAGAGVQCSGAH